MRKGLKLFVWMNVLTDYTSGIAFALANTEEEARKILLKKEDCLANDSSFKDKPLVYTKKQGFTLWGGG